MYKLKNKKRNTSNKKNTRNKRNKESKSVQKKKMKEHDDNINLDSLANDTIIINEAIKGLNKENKKTFRRVVSYKHKELKRTIKKLKKGKKIPIDKKQLKRNIKPPTKKKRIRSGSVVPEKGQPPPLPPRTENGNPPRLPPRPENDNSGANKKSPMKGKTPPEKNALTNSKQEPIKSGVSPEKSSNNWKYLAAGAVGIGIASMYALGHEPDEDLFNHIVGDDHEHMTKEQFEDAFGENGYDGNSWEDIAGKGEDEIDFDTFHDKIGEDITDKLEELCKPDDDGNTSIDNEVCGSYELGSEIEWDNSLIDKLDSED